MTAFYATLDSNSLREYLPADGWYLLPASSWARKRRSDDRPIPLPKLPEAWLAGGTGSHERLGADSGGFVATFKWGGVYRYTTAQYVDWLYGWRPAWAAMQDYCCEPEIVGSDGAAKGIIRQRQQQTTQNAYATWDTSQRAPWTWVPTVQGWEVDDYVRHARELKPLIEQMRDYYGPGSPFRVGIGTLCRRASVAMIRAVASAVSAELGADVPLHLWGIKLGALQARVRLPAAVVSVDSAAWNGMTGPHERSAPDGYHAYRDAGQGTQAQYALTVALPRYQAKVERALAQVKQLPLAL